MKLLVTKVLTIWPLMEILPLFQINSDLCAALSKNSKPYVIENNGQVKA